MIHEEICTYEVAKLAKEKGFNERTRRYYEANCVNPKAIEHCTGANCFNKYPKAVSAPTQSLLQRWLREEKGLCISVEAYPTLAIVGKVCFAWVVKSGSDGHFMESNDSLQTFYTYEHALEDALAYSLKNLV